MNDQILLVDDDPATIQILAQILSDVGNLRFAVCGEDALQLARAVVPDLILLDAEMPGMSGFLVCEALKADPLLANVSVIFISSHGEPEFELSGFEPGPADFITKPVSPPLVLARVRTQLRVKHLADDLHSIATTDVLTGIANRRHFDASLERPSVTVSIGVASYDDDSACWEPPSPASRSTDDSCARCGSIDLVQAADQAMYAAKRSGRGRACALDIASAWAPASARSIARRPREGTPLDGMRA